MQKIGLKVKYISTLLVVFSGVFFLTAGLLPVKNSRASYDSFVNTVNSQRQVGNPNADVVVVVYSDFQCPWCRKLEIHDLSKIVKNYAVTGKILIEYRDFPLVYIHPYAFKAAEYADCSALQGKYLLVRGLLYNYQDDWNVIGDIYYFLKTKAGNILNMQKEESCVKSGYSKRLIDSNIARGKDIGVKGTPMLFIYKGLMLYKTQKGYSPYPVIKSLIDGALSGS